MKIVMISTLWESTPPPRYGGTERIVSYVTEELVRRGHKVTLFATGDSKTKAKLISVYPRPLYRDKVPWTSPYDHLINQSRALEYALKIRADIIHNHAPYYGLPFIRLAGVPIVHTFHGNIGRDELSPDKQRILENFREANFISISNSQRQIKNLNYIATVYNGIPVTSFDFGQDAKEGYLAWMGRVSPKKGASQAVGIARTSQRKLLMAAKVDWAVEGDVEYFTKEIEPCLLRGKIEFLGEVDHKGKNKLLGGAKALVNPIDWEEPFGLVPAEAMACGTPVVAFARGAMPELIKDGETGFLVNPSDKDKRGNWIIKKTGLAGMVEAVKKIYAMPNAEYQAMRRRCRAHVEQNFTVEKMVDGYERVYRRVIAGHKNIKAEKRKD